MSKSRPSSLVPLESGDRLPRAEFHRRYCERPDIYKAELIDGVVYVTRRVRAIHGEAHGVLEGWLGAYAAYHPGVHVYGPVTVFLDELSEVQPDATIIHEWSLGSRLGETTDGFFAGVPDLITEAAESSASYDLHDKLESYRRAGVREYVVWQLYEQRINWFHLQQGRYVPLFPDEQGLVRSVTFPDLHLPVAKVLSGDHVAVLAAVLGR
jgi:Uma2 family endonuclease